MELQTENEMETGFVKGFMYTFALTVPLIDLGIYLLSYIRDPN